jgi:hypothetical protein
MHFSDVLFYFRNHTVLCHFQNHMDLCHVVASAALLRGNYCNIQADLKCPIYII